MKKYVKPEFYFENFKLAQHIASCGWDMNSGDVHSCTATGDPDWGYPEDVNVFVVGDGSPCEVEVESYCYTVQDGDVSIFNS